MPIIRGNQGQGGPTGSLGHHIKCALSKRVQCTVNTGVVYPGCIDYVTRYKCYVTNTMGVSMSDYATPVGVYRGRGAGL